MVPNVSPAICDGQTIEAGSDWFPELHLMKKQIFFFSLSTDLFLSGP